MKLPRQLSTVEPYWFIIAPLILLGIVVYGMHLATGTTPNRVAFTLFQLDVFWYGVVITFGIGLGAFVAARLALARAKEILAQTVPQTVGDIPLTDVELPDEILKTLRKQKIETLGELLLQWGWQPAGTALNRRGQRVVEEMLSRRSDVEPQWLTDAPWRIWHPDHIWSGLLWVMILAVIGARLYHVLTPSPSMAALGIETPLDYFQQPNQLLNLRNGGLGIYGGLLGGLLGIIIYARRQRLNPLMLADLAAVGVALGQAIGRWGNFLNQELYGSPTTLPWAVTIDPIYRLPEYADAAHFHPAFLYESLWSLLTFFVLLWVAKQRPVARTGILTALYLLLYGIGRTLLELVRLDSRTVTLGTVDLGLPIATLVSLITALLMLIFLGWHWRNGTLWQTR